MKIVFLNALLLILLISCGNPSDIIKEQKEKITSSASVPAAKYEPYSYELDGDQCTTGELFFSNFYEACNGLKDEELNLDCAKDKREKLFRDSECPGSFTLKDSVVTQDLVS